MRRAATLQLLGEVGIDFDARSVANELPSDTTAPVHVVIGSLGGTAAEGMAIYDLLTRRQGQVTTEAAGIAASAGSLIFAAGSVRLVPAASLLMIHNVHTYSSGGAADLRSQADVLDVIGESYVTAYAKSSGQTPDEVRALMAAETWMNAEQAVSLGFATRVIADRNISALFNPAAVAQYGNTPAAAKCWLLPSPPASPTMTASPAEQIQPQAAAAEARELKLRRYFASAKLAPEKAEAYIAGPMSFDDVVVDVVKEYAARVNGPAASAGHPARPLEYASPAGGGGDVAGIVARAMSGKRDRNEDPLWLQLRARGVQGRNAAEVIKAALSTSDLPRLLTGSGHRELLALFAEQQGGIMDAAVIKELVDYRPAQILDRGISGGATRLPQGGDLPFVAVN